MATSANAQYVLRLVLGAAARPAWPRHFSAAALAHGQDASMSAAAAAATSATTTKDTAVPISFLEPESDDYDTAQSLLPSREQHDAPPVPWPTVFDHGEARPKSHRRHPCDLLARLVAEKRFDSARKVYAELKALHTPISQRRIYLDAALGALEQPTSEGRQEFLLWLSLYSNRGATALHGKFKETWQPIVNRLLATHLLEDEGFFGDFLELAGQKGLLPAVIPPTTLALVASTAPARSLDMFTRAIAAYVDSTTSKTSTSERANTLRALVMSQVEQYWNIYLRALVIAGWTDHAKALCADPPLLVGMEGEVKVKWEALTLRFVSGEAVERKERALAARKQADEELRQNPMLPFNSKMSPSRGQSMNERCREALKSANLPYVSVLAAIQRDFLLQGQLQQLHTFRKSFTRGRGDLGTSILDTWWWHAEIYRLAEDGLHHDAVATFRRHFLWMGLPPTQIGNEVKVEPHVTLRVPTIQVITTVARSILEVLPKEELGQWHRRFLSQTVHSPMLQPTPMTHVSCVRPIAHRLGPTGASEALYDIRMTGQRPHIACWNAYILSLVGRGEIIRAKQLINAMEHREIWYGFKLPAPVSMTYTGVVWVLLKNGRLDEAMAMFRKYQNFLTENGMKLPEDVMSAVTTALANSENN
ncbi:uncharacterized protein EHS24_005337 [Apiotrichum porosum]|uniref:Uncharacterized protein n=1 Tax=Apiotrichum porosum TaxID=105984 RepID=A0A427XCZ6_9TREE|nr:uncharacterized protein EHS24_005337 [Apiotrichum porosum]RSH76759.1 hypothetical protein EHS24_005337 [Apiotrichum porosum]